MPRTIFRGARVWEKKQQNTFLLLLRAAAQSAATDERTKKKYEAITSLSKLDEVLSGIKNEIAIDTEATGRNPLTDSLVGISICNEKDEAFYIPVAHSPSLVRAGEQIGVKDTIRA